ncbi:MAG: hypothetical protein P9L90_00405 [Candidatus Aadella gelida]|nr:hypothetical protein [Candidatus Aadella gelida]
MQKVITTKNLCYTYKTGNRKVEALQDMDLSVDNGEIFGFIGPNGACVTKLHRR